VTHCTNQLQEFVYGNRDIGNIPSKNLPELVRRFVEDTYLCIYIDHDGSEVSINSYLMLCVLIMCVKPACLASCICYTLQIYIVSV